MTEQQKTSFTTMDIKNLQKLNKAINSDFTPELDKFLMRQQFDKILFSVKPDEKKQTGPTPANQNNEPESDSNGVTVVSENDSKKGKASK